MCPPKLPDDETLRRLEEMRRLMPSESQRQMLEQAQQLRDLTSLSQQAEQIRSAIAAITGRGTEFYQAMQHFQQGMNELAKDFVRPLVDSEVMKFLAAAKAHERTQGLLFTNSLAAEQIAQAIKQMQTSIPFETILSIRNSLVHMNDAPIRAAMETIRNLNLENVAPIFNEFVEEALERPELTKEALKEIQKARLSKKKLLELSPSQQFWTLVGIQLIGVLIMWFQLIQAGKPIKLDADQLAKLNQPQVNITNIFQAMYPTDPTYYVVIRDCNLILKPGKTSAVIYSLTPGTRVRLLGMNHQWIYVHYEEGGTGKEGWVKKKYLRRLK